MQIPINDAVTIGYVSVVHAISELEHINWPLRPSTWEIQKEVEEALEDLRNAIRMLRPHVNVADEDTRRVRESMNEYYNSPDHRHMYIGCWCE